MYMGSHTQINAAVFITMCGVLDIHIFVCVSIQGPTASEWPSHILEQKHGRAKFEQFFSSNTYKLITG